MNEEEAIEICKDIRNQEDYFGHLAIETVLNLIQKQQKKIKKLKEDNIKLDKEAQAYLEELAGDNTLNNRIIAKYKLELKKKNKIINLIKEYVQQEIDFITEDIEDYIDDDKEINKDIICELKEWREHWKDIIRIINDEKNLYR